MTELNLIVNCRVVNELPENWQRPKSWPGPGVYRVLDGVCNQDLYFVADYFVSVSFDAMVVIEENLDIPDEDIDPMAKMWAEVAIQIASKSSLKGLQ